jgi:adenine-specific DNA-methyltransferase
MAKRVSATKRSKVAKPNTAARSAESYTHPTAAALLRPDVGTQAQFRKKKPPKTYRYDSSLSPELNWDGQNPARELGEQQIRVVSSQLSVVSGRLALLAEELHNLAVRAKQNGDDELAAAIERLLTDNWPLTTDNLSEAANAAEQLKRLAKPFLNWAGKAERLSFDVPTLPLFIHERLSTAAILETLKGHKRDKQLSLFDLFGDREHPIHDQVLRAYEHKNGWVNRCILGDSLVVMNSLLNYEGLGGQVQCIYMDPPYGVKFGSNFQPFVRKRGVEHNDDEDMTREPEMVQAYRNTWELGLHSYLTYMRDRLLVARELLAPSGSMFVQISDANLHHVRELLEEVFGAENFQRVIIAQKTSTASGDYLPIVNDFVLWYSKDHERVKTKMLFADKIPGGIGGTGITHVLHADGTERRLTPDELSGRVSIPDGAKMFGLGDITSSKPPGDFPVEVEGKAYRPGKRFWSTSEDGMKTLVKSGRVRASKNGLAYLRFFNDFPVFPLTTIWTDTVGQNQFGGAKMYVVQTALPIIERCLQMTTDPGDLVLDPTCGSGTTAYVAEQWGRRWITIDTSRVPLALARQRLLTATFDYYELQDESRGPAGGFVYQRKQNKKGEEVGGIVPHVTLESIANNEPPKEEVLVDRPEKDPKITRVTGPFCVEATIPTPVDWEDDEVVSSQLSVTDNRKLITDNSSNRQLITDNSSSSRFVDRMLEVLRRSPVLQLGGGKSVTLKNVRPPAKTLSLSAEAIVESVISCQLSGEENGARVSGLGSVAEGDGPRDGNLSGDTDVSGGGTVRVGEPDAAGGRVDPQQHRRGPRPAISGGVSPVRATREGESVGTGDPDRDRDKPDVSCVDGISGASGTGVGSGSDPQRPPDVPSSLTTDNRKLTTSPVAIVFGPENGAISERTVYEAAREAHAKQYAHLFVIGFAIQSNARKLIDDCERAVGVPATYVQATMDLTMGDLLKNMRSSQSFSVCGLPDVKLSVVSGQHSATDNRKLTTDNSLYQVELLGLDVFDPITMQTDPRPGNDVPAWFLDTDYNGLCFHVCQAFFPRTAAWDDLKRSLKAEFDPSVWEHLAGTVSAPFEAGKHGEVAVKVIDDRGNELLVVKSLRDME